MSCYVVGNKTLSVLARAITEKLGNDITCAEIGGVPPIMIDVLETIDNVGSALLKENVKAYNERYNEEDWLANDGRYGEWAVAYHGFGR